MPKIFTDSGLTKLATLKNALITLRVTSDFPSTAASAAASPAAVSTGSAATAASSSSSSAVSQSDTVDLNADRSEYSIQMVEQLLVFVSSLIDKNNSEQLNTVNLLDLSSLLDGGLGTHVPAVFNGHSLALAKAVADFLKTFVLEDLTDAAKKAVMPFGYGAGKAGKLLQSLQSNIQLNIQLYNALIVQRQRYIQNEKAFSSLIEKLHELQGAAEPLMKHKSGERVMGDRGLNQYLPRIGLDRTQFDSMSADDLKTYLIKRYEATLPELLNLISQSQLSHSIVIGLESFSTQLPTSFVQKADKTGYECNASQAIQQFKKLQFCGDGSLAIRKMLEYQFKLKQLLGDQVSDTVIGHFIAQYNPSEAQQILDEFGRYLTELESDINAYLAKSNTTLSRFAPTMFASLVGTSPEKVAIMEKIRDEIKAARNNEMTLGGTEQRVPQCISNRTWRIFHLLLVSLYENAYLVGRNQGKMSLGETAEIIEKHILNFINIFERIGLKNDPFTWTWLANNTQRPCLVQIPQLPEIGASSTLTAAIRH